MALGARRSQVAGMIVAQGLKLTLFGVALGITGAFALARFLATQLYGVTTTDAATFTGACLILIVVALMACYVPARRASRIDPMIALRHE
jgi:putative ABC transport system permease protein